MYDSNEFKLDIDNTRSDGMSGRVTMIDETNGNSESVHWNVYHETLRGQFAAKEEAIAKLLTLR